jgi:hypothetical protein
VHLRAVERGKWSGVYLNNFSLSTASPLREATNSLKKAVALLRSWVQIPPLSTFINLVRLFKKFSTYDLGA